MTCQPFQYENGNGDIDVKMSHLHYGYDHYWSEYRDFEIMVARMQARMRGATPVEIEINVLRMMEQ